MSVSESLTSTYLDPKQRPSNLKYYINRAYDKLSSQTCSEWGLYNGNATYGICGVEEQELFKKIIQENAVKGQKEFYALDIGAGNFQWGASMAGYLNKQTDLPADIKVHIISVRGESNPEESIIEKGCCKIHNLGTFKIEEIGEEFKKRGLDLENKIDLAVSNWCFRHFADPVGTFVQSYNLLRPKTGTILLNGFFICDESGLLGKYSGNESLTQLFLDTRSPFVTQFNDGGRSLNHFLLRRKDETSCHLPMSYAGEKYIDDVAYQVGSSIITKFKRTPQTDDAPFTVPCNWEKPDMHGDKDLHDWLKQNHLLSSVSTSWKPIQNKDNALGTPPLHKAILEDDTKGAIECLNNGSNINESDVSGNTPLHLAIQKGNKALFELLLSKKPDLKLHNERGRAAIQEAAVCDKEGSFITALIAAGADANMHETYFIDATPLDVAIAALNVKAVEILLKNGAKPSERNATRLKEEPFTPPPKVQATSSSSDSQPPNAFAEVYGLIKAGECVVLHHNGYDGIYYFIKNPNNPDPKMIIVNINPETHLLDKDEWPDFLKIYGYDYRLYNKEELPDLKEKVYYDIGY